MYFIIIMAVIGVVASILVTIHFIRENGGFGAIVGILVSILIMLFAIVFIGLGISSLLTPSKVDISMYNSVAEEEEIVALQDTSGVKGKYNKRMFLGSGYIESDLYYFYITQLNNGCYVTKKAPADSSYIFYTEDQPKVIKYTTLNYKDPKLNFWALPPSYCYYDFYIPKGSMELNFNVDLQ